MFNDQYNLDAAGRSRSSRSVADAIGGERRCVRRDMNAGKRKWLVASLALMLCSVGNAHSSERDASLINSFQVLCTLEAPIFERINQRAVAMKLPVRRDIGQPSNTGAFVHSKSWLVTLKTGPHELVAGEANGPQGYVSSCGISAPDPNGESLKSELVSMMKLDHPSSETISQDGVMRVTEWKDTFGLGTLLQLVDATPKNKSGAMLFYIVHETTKP